MGPFSAPDWGKTLMIETPVLETVVRGSLTYLALFVLLRVAHRREAGAMGVADLLVLVLIADAAQNAMAGGYTTIADGVLLVAVILFWAWLLDWLAFRSRLMEHFINPPKVTVVLDGRMHRRNMRRELITEDELMTELRQQGVEDIADVRRAYVEYDGKVSVLRREGGDTRPAPDDPPV